MRADDAQAHQGDARYPSPPPSLPSPAFGKRATAAPRG